MTGHVDPINVPLVEDDPDDIVLTMAGFRLGKFRVDFEVVRDGVETVDFLRRRGDYRDALRPDLILLDLNLPRMQGREVLADIQSAPDLAVIPVMILTTSEAEKDIYRSYQLHANCYITKPVGVVAFADAVRHLEDFWLAVVRIPSAHQ